MATITVPAHYVGHLKSAAVYTLAEEACRVRDGEDDVRKAELGPERKLDIAKTDLENVRPFLGMMINLYNQIVALPDDEDAHLEDDPELDFYVLHNMAGKILGPQVEARLHYLPMPDELPVLAEALRWASSESIRLEAERVAEIRETQADEAVAA